MRVVTVRDVKEAKERLADRVAHTAVSTSRALSLLSGFPVWLKQEQEQKTGSFKIRGATNKILRLTEAEKKKGVIACSAGNHAQGVATGAALAGVRATIVMPVTAPIVKVDATRSYGAEVVLFGEDYDQAAEHARSLVQSTGATFVPPFEDPDIIAGQGTLGLELLEAIPDLATVLVPVGGGGLISGVATAIKAARPQVRVIGVQAAAVPTLYECFRQKSLVVNSPRGSTIADGISVKKPSAYIFDQYLSKLVDDMVAVDDEDIAQAIVFLLERAKMVVEGSGAVGVAALLSGKVKSAGPCCAVLSGGNIDLNLVAKIIQKGLSRSGRLGAVSIVVRDVPGTLSRITTCLAEHRANVIDVTHDRTSHGLHILETRIDFLLETSSSKHLEEVRQALQKQGYKLVP